MARTLRIEYPGAIYHVLNRGNYRSRIFEEEGAKRAFQQCLFETCERAGWILHAYCIMGNHYHLAVETLEPNLSEGMRWLQSVYANRYNRFRKESGHLFQGRFKSIVVGDSERLAWLCHYIHLNPVRAGICDVAGLKNYEFSSYRQLRWTRSREAFMRFDAFLDGAGELKDTTAGRSKYEQYLSWLNENEAAKKDALFDQMSRGWAMGTKGFKQAVLADAQKRLGAAKSGELSNSETRELGWERELERCLAKLGKGSNEIDGDSKSADWKVAIAARLKRSQLCKNPWLSERLKMGAYAGVSRYVSEMEKGERKGAAKLFKKLS